MRETIACRSCGRRVVVPASLDRQRARCPKCRTKLAAVDEAPVREKAPDAYETFLSQSLQTQTAAPAKVAEKPLELPEEVLSLDDALPADPRPQPIAPAPALLPPPFRFPIRIRDDSEHRLAGQLHAVLTPHGLFLEREPNRPLAYFPPGTPCRSKGSTLHLQATGRWAFQVRATQAGLLATDITAFLAGQRPVPLPAEYRRPWWLVGIGAMLALGLAAGPIAMANSAEVAWWIGLVLAAAFALVAGTVNAAIALFVPLANGLKVAVMAAAAFGLLMLLLFGAAQLLPEPPPPTESPTPSQPPTQKLDPQSPLLAPTPSVRGGPPTWYELIYRDGMARLDDGTADVTALAVSPTDDSVVVGHADGSVRIWPLDQAYFEAPRLGPRGSGAIHRIDFHPASLLALISCSGGLVVAPLDAPPRAPLLVPGELATASMEPKRERFAAIRKNRIHVRYVPMAMVHEPPEKLPPGPFLTTSSKDETLPLNLPLGGQPAPNGGATFLAWHPSGRLLCGHRDGVIAAVRAGGPAGQALFVSREHTAAVRSWAISPYSDFATGDDDGYVGYWPREAKGISKFRTGTAPIKGLSFNECGGELAVLDATGRVSVWDPVDRKQHFEVKPKGRVAAVAYGPRDDLLMIADGKGVQIWWVPELAEQSQRRLPD
ncbi:MAG TPA: WD40 repeat domain-containing protein [Gemmataceae bacterium]